jgi:hypothetical protein
MTVTGKSPYPRTVALLQDAGIDANAISVEHINEASYMEIVLSPEGERVINSYGNIAARRREWGVPGLGERVMEAMRQDIAASIVATLPGSPQITPDTVVLLRRRCDVDPTPNNRFNLMTAEKALTKAERALYLKKYKALPIIDPEKE